MLRRLTTLLVAIPAALVLVTLAVTNRQAVPLVLDPFNAEPRLLIELPFYAHLLLALIAGALLGGASVWIAQGRYRRSARVRGSEARRWRHEADRLTRERDAQVASHAKALVAPSRRDAA
jgi:uncharacterized integral membrane protein